MPHFRRIARAHNPVGTEDYAMRTLIIAAFAALSLASPVLADVAFLQSSYVSGLNRVCVYKSSTGTVVITIPVAQVCPVQIRV